MISGAIRAAFLSVVVQVSPAVAETLRLDGTELVTSQGETVAFDADLFGRGATIVSFTYTGCRSVCPTADLTMEFLAKGISDARLDVGLLTFTIDPITDQPETLERRRVDVGGAPNRTWITGDPRAVHRVVTAMGMEFQSVEEHPAFFLAIGRNGSPVYRILERDADPETLLQRAAAAAAN